MADCIDIFFDRRFFFLFFVKIYKNMNSVFNFIFP